MTEAPSRAAPREAVRQRVGLALLGMLKTALELREQAARKQHLHPTDFACISYLHGRAHPVSPKEIIAELGLTSGSGTALLDRLEQAGYIRRLPNPDDRRGVLVDLDRKAAARPIAQYAQMQAAYRTVTDDFTEAELDVVARFLERVAQRSAGEDRDDG